MSAQEIAVRFDGLVKRYGKVEAVRGIDLDVRRGEVFGFLGPNGAGKSTTIRCLVGLLRPTAGRVDAFGLDPTRDGVALRRRIAYVPGELRLLERLSGLDLIASIGRLRGGFDPSRRDVLADRLRLDLRRPLRDLSSGNRRKIALLLAFLADADLLVLDEPTSGLDPLMQHEFLGLVREAQAAGTTVFLSSHVLSEVQRVADRVAVLRSGRIVALGTVPELRGRARLRVETWFEDEAPAAELAALPGVVDPIVDGRRFTATLAGSVQPLVDLLARHRVASLLVEEPDLEEAFLDLYEGYDP
ncbi:MAG: ABC transporter ATP-binding protein [Chloroflexota bacterium]|nr:ABC transporter ATP-binding protein [Chloroflexota bacterium]